MYRCILILGEGPGRSVDMKLGKTMFEEFLEENYGITMSEYVELSIYERRIIEREWEAYTNSLFK